MSAAASLADLRDRLDGPVHLPGTPGYAEATRPRNATARQTPAAVVAVTSDEDVAACVRWAGRAGLSVVVQATGHGAGSMVGEDALLVNTSRLDGVEVDPERRIVRAGAGATLAAVNAAAFRHGLLAPAGTAPDVAVAGYVAHGGVGWLTRPHGLASGSLVSVQGVDGSGERLRGEVGDDEETLWAWRGGGGVGIATQLQLQLYPASQLWAGYLLWPAEHAETVIPAWGAALPMLDRALSSTVSILHAPDAPTVPEDLRGQPVVHLAAASVAGETAGQALRELLRDLPPPALDTLGECDAERLTTIHLDPPASVPAIGEGRWLTSEAGTCALDILTACGTDLDSPLSELELRHVATSTPPDAPGALTACPGDVLLHAVGAGPDPEARREVRDALKRVLSAARPFDTGRSAAAFRDGQDSAPDALEPTARERLSAVRRRVDPHGVIAVSRALA